MGTRELAAQIAANYASQAKSAHEVLQLLHDSYNSLIKMEGEGRFLSSKESPLAGPGEAGAEVAIGGTQPADPVMAPQKAISNDAITCLVCGQRFKTLKRHLNNAHGMAPQQYRERFGLDKDYPLVAPNLSQQRARVAKERGLGERLAEARRQQRQVSS